MYMTKPSLPSKIISMLGLPLTCACACGGSENVIDIVGVDSYPAQAWIDAQGRVRRMKVTMSFGAQFGTPISMTLTEDLYDFGVRATIFPPPDDQVVDLSSFVSG